MAAKWDGKIIAETNRRSSDTQVKIVDHLMFKMASKFTVGRLMIDQVSSLPISRRKSDLLTDLVLEKGAYLIRAHFLIQIAPVD